MAKVPKTIKLARLPTGWQDQPQLLERYWDETMTAIERSLNAVLEIPVIRDYLDRKVGELDQAAKNAQDAADAAQTAADFAKAQAENQARESSLSQSYVDNYTGDIVTVNADGLVTIANHRRVYGDPILNPSVNVQGASFTVPDVTEGNTIRVYYVDVTRSGGSVAYEYTIDPTNPRAQTGDTHSVAATVVPAAGQPPRGGGGVRPPGYVYQTIQNID